MPQTQIYKSIRQYSEFICEPLNIEDYIPQPVVFASPPKWHLAHTTWFFEQMILQSFNPDYQVFDKDFSYLFNSYYNTLGDRVLRADRGNLTRPNVEEVYAYRKYVDEGMVQLMESPSMNQEIANLIELGLNHEQQHQELLITDFKYNFGHNPLFPVYHENRFDDEEILINQEWIKTEEGVYKIGFDHDSFCYDNEKNAHRVFLESFEISNRLVTNAEFIEFIEAGGYNKFEFWLDEAWTWINSESINSPLYWHKIDGEWFHYTLQGLKKINRKKPLNHISFYEANAFATWKGLRLPTEAEWEVASDKFNWGDRWEWTNSAYLPYPGFKIAEGVVGEYNGKFMVNQMVLRGASKYTSENHSRKTYRNFFHPHFQWQCSGIRLAK